MTLLSYYLCVYLFFSTNAYTRSAIRIETKSGFIDVIPKNETFTTSSTTTTTKSLLVAKIDEKEITSLLLKMLTIATGSDKHVVTTKNTQISTTEKLTTTPHGMKAVIENKPKKYTGVNGTISRLCPYFVSDSDFKMEKMPAVYWPRFYNLKEPLKCFKIDVMKLTEKQINENEINFGTFGGVINWRECNFEIKPPKNVYSYKRRHFLFGGDNDSGVMRNIIISKNDHGEFILQEESPDQWVMLRNLILLRDCVTGEVVVFTKSPQHTSTSDMVEVLQDLGEELTGQMVCDEDDDWLRDYYVKR